jgi:hypothetical protein
MKQFCSSSTKFLFRGYKTLQAEEVVKIPKVRKPPKEIPHTIFSKKIKGCCTDSSIKAT